MSNLEELKRKRKEIDDEIKKLLNADFMQVGNVKFDKDHFPTARPDEYYVAVQSKIHCGRNPGQEKLLWRSVIRSQNKQEVIDRIPKLVKNMKELHAALEASQKAD